MAWDTPLMGLHFLSKGRFYLQMRIYGPFLYSAPFVILFYVCLVWLLYL